MAKQKTPRRELDKRGYVLGGYGPMPDQLPRVRDPGPGAGAVPKVKPEAPKDE